MKVAIVGAGVAGLSAGVFALQSGFEVTIYEAHNIPGGNSTSWKRNGYFIEGGMHWLVGSSETTALNKLWHEVGALQSNNPIYNRDPFLTYIDKDTEIALYRDSEKLKRHLMKISPQDEKATSNLIKDINAMKSMTMPTMDIKGVKVKYKAAMPFSMLFSYLKAGKTMKRLSKITIKEYISNFQHEGIRTLLSSVVSMEDYSAMSLIFTMSGLAAGDSGYPKGGSLQMSQNIAATFLALGGTIKYNTKIDCVNVKDNKADGVWIKDEFYKADAVVVTTDTLHAVDHLFHQPLHEPWMDELRKETIPVNCTFIALGATVDLSHLPENIVLELKSPILFAGNKHHTIALNNYAKFEGYAPKGCTSLTMMFFEDTYDEWKNAYADGTYVAKKEALATMIIKSLEETIPELKGQINVWDIATPLTYERYCGTYRGSWMSVMKPNLKRQSYPSKSESIERLYFAGQRLVVPGGLPVALTTGRTAVQHLCKDTGTVYQCKYERT